MAAKTEPEEMTLDTPVLMRHLNDLAVNPNVMRNIGGDAAATAAIVDEGYNAVTDAMVPGDGFASKSVSVKARKMKTAFDANGETGNVGDWLVFAFGHWHVVKDADL